MATGEPAGWRRRKISENFLCSQVEGSESNAALVLFSKGFVSATPASQAVGHMRGNVWHENFIRLLFLDE